MARPRLTAEERHNLHHRLMEERVQAWRDAPARSGLDRLRKRELAKKAYWTVRGHLQDPHGQRNAPPDALVDDLLARHLEAHAETPDVP